MATLEQVEAALRAADAAGNVDDARALAQAYKEMKAAAEPKEKPYSARTQALSAVSGVNRTPAFLAGLPVDTLLNTADLLKAGIGFTQSKITGKAPSSIFDPVADRSRFVGTSAWFNRGLDRAGVTQPAAEAEYPTTSAMATGATSALTGRPTTIGQTLIQTGMGGASGVASQKAYEATGDPAAAALAGIGVPGALAAGGVGATRLAGKFAIPAEEVARILLSKKPEERIAAQTWQGAIGKDGLPIVRNRIDRGMNQSQPVHGYQPTVGELLTDRSPDGSFRITPEAAGVAAIQKSLGGTPGAPQSIMRDFRYAQDDALRNAIGGIAGTPKKLEAAVTARRTAADANYPAALALNPQADKTLMGLASSPYFESAYKASRAAAADLVRKQSGVPLTTTQELHLVKLAMDGMLERKVGDTALSATERRNLTGVQNEVVDWLAKNNPKYEVARDTFQRQSVPIDRMQSGQELQRRMFSPGGNATPVSFINATRDPEVMGGLSPMAQNRVNDVGGLLQRRLAVESPKNPVRVGNSSAVDEALTAAPNVLSTPVVVGKWIVKNVARNNVEPRVDELMALQATNPKLFRAALNEIPNGLAQQIVNAIASRQVTQSMGRGLLGGSMPGTQGSLNAYLEPQR